MEVIRLGAMCELEHISDASSSFRVSEYAVLVNGQRLQLHKERGFALTKTTSGRDNWTEVLRSSILTTVLPDDDESGEQHPWVWLCQLLDRNGIQASPEQLKTLPYDVEFSEQVRDAVSAG